MKKLFFIKYLLIFTLFLISSCKSKTSSEKSNKLSVNEGYDKNLANNRYDWTGTYELTDNNELYILKLHKRSVDASYEMQFYNNGKNTELYKSSIYDAKDDKQNIYIKFLNNFNMDASSLGFKNGDTLFILQHYDANDSTIFKSFNPKTKNTKWQKISDNFN